MSVSWPGSSLLDLANWTPVPVDYTISTEKYPSYLHPYLDWNENPTPVPILPIFAKGPHNVSTRAPTKKPKPTKLPKTTTKKPNRPTTIVTTKRPRPTKSHRPATTKHPTKPRPTTHRPPRPPHITHKTTRRPRPTTVTASPTVTTSPTATTTEGSDVYELDATWDDATWVLINSIIIFTMQTGFGLLESGCVARKNVANILMKNVVDIVLGGFFYWIIGFSFSYGADPGSNGFIGVGEYFVDSDYDMLGPVMVKFFFQLSFATTSTTIVSGTMAERCNFKAYCIFAFFNTIVYSVPCRWIWGTGGWLADLGCIDIAGSGAVHLLGGVSGYVSAWMLGPRLGRYDNGTDPVPLQNPLAFIWGTFILWWGWLAFNSGSTFGIAGDLWKFAARAAVTTMIASIGGGLVGSLYTVAKPGNFFDVTDLINPILGGLVGVTAGCALFHTFDAFIVGIIGGAVALVTAGFADWTRVDDPVGATAVHGFCGIWGMVAVGLFAEDDGGAGFSRGNMGLFRGGTFYLLLIQLLACVCIVVWSALATFLLLFLINLVVPIRMKLYEELLGADYSEHLIRKRFVGITPAESAFGSNPHVQDIIKHSVVVEDINPAHETILQAFHEINGHRRWKKLVPSATSYQISPAALKHSQHDDIIKDTLDSNNSIAQVPNQDVEIGPQETINGRNSRYPSFINIYPINVTGR